MKKVFSIITMLAVLIIPIFILKRLIFGIIKVFKPRYAQPV